MIKDKEIRDKIRKIGSGRVIFDEPMYLHTSMGVGGKTDILISPGTVEELKNITAYLAECNIPFLPVGNCTNLIVKDGGYRGAIISLKSLENIEMEEARGEKVHICAEAGASLSRLIDLSIRESLSGMEFCAGIPGSVGGGMKMNAGAYGRELKDIVKEVSLIDSDGIVKETPRDDLQFEYRNLDLPERSIIVSATFGLRKGSQEKIQEEVLEILLTRRKKHPLSYRTAGSVFKNPRNMPAGKIIEELGLKGFQVGDAEISKIHGNFIVNLGKAKAGDILTLVDTAQKIALEKRGIHLEPEIKIIGED
jgi:UDP-N-acetylmuramate dehydrogenase